MLLRICETMRRLLFLVFVCTFFKFLVGQTNDESNLNPDWSYCFEFTWFGPGYDNFTRYNGTCTDYLDTTRAGNNIPCSPPAVITEDGSPPDINLLFEEHKASVLCKRADGQVCASYTYKYNGVVNNATYMCTKVQDIEAGAITSGCYTQNIDGYDIDLCVCKSNPGVYKPCNSAQYLKLHSGILLLLIFYLI